MIRVVVADDHAIVRAGIRALFAGEPDVTVVAEAADGKAAFDAVERHTPDVIVIDLSMPGANGIDAILRIRAAAPRVRVLVLSMHATPDYVRPAARAGAHGYVVKGSGLEDLVRALRLVARGETFFEERVRGILDDGADTTAGDDSLDALTPREREVLQLVAEGYTNRRIAERLGLSPKTVDAHRCNLMRKLGLHDARAVARFALRRGLISSDS